MKQLNIELVVGVFVLVGIVCLGYLSVRFAKMEVSGNGSYEVVAVFSNVGGLRKGASIEIAGVPVGRVRKIELDDYRALVTMSVKDAVTLQTDTIASIKTKGLIGEKYVELSPGGEDELLGDGDKILDTQPAVDLEQLISKFVFGKVE